jgi:transcriptional regulator with XRE-family HTH domain
MSQPKKAGVRSARPVASSRPREGSISLGDFIRRQREMANLSLRKMAEQSGVSAAVLREIESGLRHPSRTIVQSLAAALRLSAETLYLQAGVLDPQEIEESPAVREIRRDPHLTERQRETLTEIYAAFRVANRHLDELKR